MTEEEWMEKIKKAFTITIKEGIVLESEVEYLNKFFNEIFGK